jgi:hypothetical protein
MDQFGQEVIKIDDKWINLSRSVLCRGVYRSADSITISESGPCTHVVKPHIYEKGYTDKESLHKIKHNIWSNLFSFGENHPYNEERHYPHIFSVYLKGKLNIDIVAKERLDLFIEQIRNFVFVHVTYTCPPDLVAAANWMSDGTLRMESFKKYVITVGTETWLK